MRTVEEEDRHSVNHNNSIVYVDMATVSLPNETLTDPIY